MRARVLHTNEVNGGKGSRAVNEAETDEQARGGEASGDANLEAAKAAKASGSVHVGCSRVRESLHMNDMKWEIGVRVETEGVCRNAAIGKNGLWRHRYSLSWRCNERETHDGKQELPVKALF